MGFQRGNKHAEHPNAVATRIKSGQHISSETEFKKGEQKSLAWLEKQRARTGDRNPAWKGGLEFRKPSEKKHESSRYMGWMFSVKNRDRWKCRIENAGCHGKLEAHHILNWVDYPELRYEVNNGITLCHAHHPRKWAEEEKLIPFFNALVLKSSEQL